MESRMEKYHEIDIEEFQRSKKNADLYKEVYGNYSDLEDLPIPENTNEIDIENLKSLVTGRTAKRKETIEKEELIIEETMTITKEEKVYDINTLLEKAKEENAKIKKEIPINKNIPNYLANLESDKTTQEIILKYDKENDDDLPIVKEVKYTTTEINLNNQDINTSNLSLDILSDLKPTGNTQVSEPIKDEIKALEEEFYSGKLDFSKEDFEDNEEELLYEENNHLFLKILLIILGISTLLVAAYFILKEYTNLF